LIHFYKRANSLETMSEETKTIIEEQEESPEIAMPPPPEKSIDIEKIEEQKLKSKFPGTSTLED